MRWLRWRVADLLDRLADLCDLVEAWFDRIGGRVA